MSASLTSLGQPAGDGEPAATAGLRSRRKGNLEDEHLAHRSCGIGADIIQHSLPEREGRVFLSEWSFVCRTVAAAYRLLWRLLPLWGRPGREGSAKTWCWRGSSAPGRLLCTRPVGKCLGLMSTPKVQRSPQPRSACAPCFIFIWYIMF